MGHISQALLLLTSYLALTWAQGLNVLIVHDQNHRQAENGVATAIKYLAGNNMGNINKQSMVTLTGQPVNAAGDICRELDSMIDSGTPPDVVLDLSTAGDTSEVVKSLSLTLGLPTVSSSMGKVGDIREWSGLTGQQEKYLVQVRSPTDMFQYIFKDMATLTHINNAAILFDESFKMTEHYKHLLLNVPVRHTLTMMKMDSEELKEQFYSLVYETDITNFFILASPDNIKNALVAADKIHIVGHRYTFFVGTKETDYEFDASCCSDMRVISFQPKKPSGSQLRVMKGFGLYTEPLLESAFYADLTAKTLASVAKMKKGSWPEMTYTKCSQFPGGQPIERSLDLMSALKVSGVEDVWGKFHLSANGESHMELMLRVHLDKALDNSLIESNALATWTAGIPSSLNLKSPEMEEMAAFYKARTVYKVVSVIQPPFMEWNEAKGTYEGYAYDMMEEIKTLLDIEYELYIAPDGYGYATLDPKGNYKGNGTETVVGDLHLGKADIGLGAISVMPEGEHLIDYTVPFYNPVGLSILMKKTKVDTNLFKFFYVLEEIVWGVILATYFVTSFLLWVFDRFSPFSYQNNVEKFEDDDEKRSFGLKESLWFCMTSLTPQGGGEAPKSMSGRMVAATWWLFGFIIVASFTANLAAFLTVSRLAVDIGSLDDLVASSQIEYAPINSSDAAKYFENMAYIESRYYETWKDMSLDPKITEWDRAKLAVWDYPVSDKYTKIYRAMLDVSKVGDGDGDDKGLPMSMEEALEKMEAGEAEGAKKFALIADATDVRYQALTDCSFRMVGEEFSPKPYALAVQKGSPLKERLDQAILTLSNQRKLEGLKEKWWNQNENRMICEDESTGAIGIEDVGGIFIVVFVGLILALLGLGAEYYYYKFRANKSTDKDGDSGIKKVAEIE